MIFDELIFDRTANDVTDVLNGIDNKKGAWNYTDLNRLEMACSTLVDLLDELVNIQVEIVTKTNWSALDGVIANELDLQFERIRNNVDILRTAFYSTNLMPVTPTTLSPIGFEKANNLEKIIFDVYKLVINYTNSILYADNEIYINGIGVI